MKCLNYIRLYTNTVHKIKKLSLSRFNFGISPIKRTLSLKSGVPNLWATSHYWAMAGLEQGCVSGLWVCMHVQLHSRERPVLVLGYAAPFTRAVGSCEWSFASAHCSHKWSCAHERRTVALAHGPLALAAGACVCAHLLVKQNYPPTCRAAKLKRLGTAGLNSFLKGSYLPNHRRWRHLRKDCWRWSICEIVAICTSSD